MLLLTTTACRMTFSASKGQRSPFLESKFQNQAKTVVSRTLPHKVMTDHQVSLHALLGASRVINKYYACHGGLLIIFSALNIKN